MAPYVHAFTIYIYIHTPTADLFKRRLLYSNSEQKPHNIKFRSFCILLQVRFLFISLSRPHIVGGNWVAAGFAHRSELRADNRTFLVRQMLHILSPVQVSWANCKRVYSANDAISWITCPFATALRCGSSSSVLSNSIQVQKKAWCDMCLVNIFLSFGYLYIHVV